jgi:16S rRNA (adenine1518-N6/adenine1519-N6)-dimethyltransferase
MIDPRDVLRELEQRARKRFGQHFLTREDIVRRIVRGAGVVSGDLVVEVGPGLGILTDALVEAGATVTAIELDRDLAAYLQESRPHVRVIQADAMKVDWDVLIPSGDAKLVSNLPYNVGTGIVSSLVTRRDRFRSLTVMLQREVVERMVAVPGSDAYGSLSVHIAAHARADALFRVPPSAFHPPPKVESGVIRLDLLDAPLVGSAGAAMFERTVRAAFAQRRKTILNSLSSLFPREAAAAALAACGLDPRVRAETLDREAFVRLAEALAAVC